MASAAPLVWAAHHNSRVAAKICPKEREVMLRLGVIISMIFGGMLLTAQDVKTDYDHSFNFAQVHTFAVKIGTSWGNPLTEGRAKTAVSDALVKRGWGPAPDEASADALVVIHGATQDKQSLNTFYSGGGWGGYGWGGMGGGTATTTVNNYTVGTMVVDIFDAKDKKLIFRGTAQDEVSNKPDKNTKKIDKAADKMFKDFPPQPKSEK
jgi:Domain of unknown function (DUF4136)